MKFGIIAIGYNRADDMGRLLSRLNQCEYGEEQPLLIISIDKADNMLVEECAEAFHWNHGEKIIKTFPSRQGLQKHIMHCGNYMEEYDLDAVAVFEDDIVPSVDFYNFMEQAVAFYHDDEEIAGIALYSHRWNPIANKPFLPMDNGSAVYFSRFACSWGQVWMRCQWNRFVEWLERSGEQAYLSADMPEEIKKWKNSWLKYHIAYCVCENKYYVYPYKSFATCYAGIGEHTEQESIKYQVSMVADSGNSYSFIPASERAVLYDAYFENKTLQLEMGDKGFDVSIDLYGLKGNPKKARYWLCSERHPYKIVKRYGLIMRPHEVNIFSDISGDDIFLYDITQENNKSGKRQSFSMKKFVYYFNGSIDKRIVPYYIKSGIDKYICKVKNIFK